MDNGYALITSHFIVRALENSETKQRCEFMVASLRRKPTGLVTGMASAYAMNAVEDIAFWKKILKDVLDHPKATLGAVVIAKDVIESD